MMDVEQMNVELAAWKKFADWSHGDSANEDLAEGFCSEVCPYAEQCNMYRCEVWEVSMGEDL